MVGQLGEFSNVGFQDHLNLDSMAKPEPYVRAALMASLFLIASNLSDRDNGASISGQLLGP